MQLYFELLLRLPTATTLPLNSQDIGTSGWQLVDKAILLARVGEGGGPRAEQCRLSGADRPTYALVVNPANATTSETTLRDLKAGR